MNLNYTIKQVNTDGTIVLSCAVDNKDQHISGVPVSDAQAFNDFCDAYTLAYVIGLEQEKEAHQIKVIDPAVQALVNHVQTVTQETTVTPQAS